MIRVLCSSAARVAATGDNLHYCSSRSRSAYSAIDDAVSNNLSFEANKFVKERGGDRERHRERGALARESITQRGVGSADTDKQQALLVMLSVTRTEERIRSHFAGVDSCGGARDTTPAPIDNVLQPQPIFAEPSEQEFKTWFPGLPLSKTACGQPRSVAMSKQGFTPAFTRPRSCLHSCMAF